MKCKVVIMMFAGLLIQAVNLNATNYFVSNSGNDGNSGLTPNTPFLTMQKAVDVVSTGDTVFVENGIYAGNPVCFIRPRSKNLFLLEGQYLSFAKKTLD